jgi:hypothetical protein
MRLRVIAATLALLGAALPSLGAQSSFLPGAEVNGQINVQIIATLDDGIGGYMPLADLPLILYRGATDSTTLRTDEAGVLRFSIAPGTYRLSTPERIEWHGRSYRWNLPLSVAKYMSVVNLTAGNATIGGPIQGSLPAQKRDAAEPARAVARTAYSPKDGAVGVLFGFLLTGGGQFYAGNNAKGAVLLGLSLAEVIASLSIVERCDPYCTDSEMTTAGALLLPAVFNWVYGMATAPGDVRKWNEAHGVVARVRPMMRREEGRTGVGLAVGF